MPVGIFSELDVCAAGNSGTAAGDDAASEGEGCNETSLARQRATAALAALQQGDKIAVQDAEASYHETKPPCRYTEGTLVKALEEQVC